MANFTGRSFDCVCGRKYERRSSLTNHQKKCQKYIDSSVEGIDFVRCKLCGEVGKSITSHVKKHGLSKKEYKAKYGPTVCKKTKTNYSDTKNYDWIRREKEKGNDLKEYREKLSSAISKGIMSSPSARKARRKNLSSLNKTEEFRKRSSEVAKKTSSRKDILENRTKQLREWRENHPDEFYEKCTSVMINSWKSKPELHLFKSLNEKYSFLKRNQKLHRKGKFLSTRSNIRQIDIMSIENKIIVEFDGVHHFKNIHGQDVLEKNKLKDKELNEVMTDEGWTVIRVSHDQYTYKSGEGFKKECLDEVTKIIETKERGLFLIGESYEKQQ
jgi:very-short-patch-repair endonuclease